MSSFLGSSKEGRGRLRLRMARTLLRAGLLVRSARLPRRRSLTVAEGLKSSWAGVGSESEESEEGKGEEGELEEEEAERNRVGEVGIGRGREKEAEGGAEWGLITVTRSSSCSWRKMARTSMELMLSFWWCLDLRQEESRKGEGMRAGIGSDSSSSMSERSKGEAERRMWCSGGARREGRVKKVGERGELVETTLARLLGMLVMLMTESRWEDLRATEERKRSCSSTETREGPGTGGSGSVGGPVGGGLGGFGMWEGGVGNASRRTR